jgi:hypothetical protein
MSENNMINKDNDEIDLVDLLRKVSDSILNLFKAVGKAIMISIVFLLRNWLPLGFSLFLGVGVSYALKYIMKPGFSSEMVLKSNTLPAEELINYINKLHTFCEEENFPALSSSLSLNEQSIRLIDDISAFWIIDINADKVPDYVDFDARFNVYDTNSVRMGDRLNIRVKTKSISEFANIKAGILHYINSDSLFQQRNRVRNQQNNKFLQRLDFDIVQLDSLQKVKIQEESKARIPGKDNQIIFMQEQKTQLVYTDIYKLYETKKIYEIQLELYKDIVTVLSDLTVPFKPYTRAKYYAVYAIPICFGLMLLILLLYRNKSSLKELFEKF